MSASTRAFLVAAALLSIATAASAANLKSIPTVYCDDEITLRATAREVQFGDDPIHSFMMRTRVFEIDGVTATSPEDYFPAPTIVMSANKRCRVHVINELSDDQDASCNPGHHSNTHHCPNSTVLHTHGLHVSTYDDNIKTNVLPGESLTYNYSVPSDHLPGTHWYHAHKHGSTALQVAGGMAGALFVDPSPENYIYYSMTYQNFYVNDANTHLMVMTHHFTGDGDAGGGGFSMNSLTELNDMFPEASTGQLMPLFDDAVPNHNFYTVNNQYNPTVQVASRSTHLLRIVHVGTWRILRLVPDSSMCSVRLVARDGVFQKPDSTTFTDPFPELSSIVLIQGTRADIAVKCTGAVGDKIVFMAAPGDASFPLGDQNIHEQSEMFTIEITEADFGFDVPPTLDEEDMSTSLPSYLMDLSFTTADQPLDATQFYNDAPPNTVVAMSFGGGAINQIPFPGYGTNSYVASFCVDKVYEMMLGPPPPGGSVNNGPAHPFHMHINHVQVQSLPDEAAWSPEIARVGEWRDTLPAKAVGIKFPTHRYTGEVITHCHILEHEDEGMMGLFSIGECCTAATDCSTTCRTGTPVCQDGQCAADLAPEGTPCMNEFGSTGSCSSYGECVDFCANSDCSDGNPCTEDICQLESGYCTWATDTTKCPVGLTKSTCDAQLVEGSYTGAWQCVECTDDFQCYDGQTCDLSTNTCTLSCVDTSECASLGKVCVDGSCRACESDDMCKDGFICSPDNECVECVSTTDCGGAVCTPEGTCRECAADADCSGAWVCEDRECYECRSDTDCGAGACSSGHCVECMLDSDCPTGSTCSSDNKCEAPPAGCASDADCPTGETCDTSDGSCHAPAGCTSDADCPTGEVCNTSDGSCHAPAGCTSDADCPTGETCDTSDGSCHTPGCTSDVDCPTGEVCNTSDGQCYTCVVNADCPVNEMCQANACVAMGCSMDTDCPTGEVCNTSDGICYDCLSNTDCPMNEECQANACVPMPCSGDGDCPTGKRCDVPNGDCVDCLNHGDCDGDWECGTDKKCHPPPCTSDADCDNGLMCTAAGDCVECMDYEDCPANHMCFDGECVESDGPPCGSDGDCTGDAAYCKMNPMNPGMPGHCVECIPDMHECDDGEWCNPDGQCDDVQQCMDGNHLFMWVDDNDDRHIATDRCADYHSPSVCQSLETVEWGTPGSDGHVKYWILGALSPGAGLAPCYQMPPMA